MPYLAYDFDAFENAEMIARSAGISIEKVTHGSLLMWRHVWRSKSELVTTAHIVSFYGCNACEALALYGQLEASEGGWRVRGAAKWLKVQQAQSEAGKTHSANLQKGRKDLEKDDVSPGGLRVVSGSSPALAASSQQPTAIKEKTAGKKPPALSKPPDPRHAPLVKALVDAVPAYGFDGRDAKAVSHLLAKGDPDEVLRRWRRANARSDFPTVRTLSELVTNWAHFATDSPRGAYDPDQGIISSRHSPPPPSKQFNLDEPTELPF